MSLLETLNTILEGLRVNVETGIFKGKAPEEYAVLTPLTDTFHLYADNAPQCEVQEIRISLYSMGNYNGRKNQIVRALLQADITITDRRYMGYEQDTGYHHYAIDVAKEYEIQEE